jgi:hypothetical protein
MTARLDGALRWIERLVFVGSLLLAVWAGHVLVTGWLEGIICYQARCQVRADAGRGFLVYALLYGGVLVLGAVSAVRSYRHLQQWKSGGPIAVAEHFARTALASFRDTKVVSGDPRQAFDGATARIVLQELVGAGPVLTVYARNDQGEYFMFKASGSSTWVKHVPHPVARQVLKGRYREGALRGPT